jgi:glycosyltransferase involved in cell wall biosynthesis
MVDRKLFCIEKPEDQLKAVRERLTFGIANAYLMVYVGRVTMEKDVQFLVDALDRLPKNVVLALIGPGSATAELSKLHGANKRLYCTGQLVGRPEVALAMRAADICVSASVMETIGFTAMESLSCGTPMLAARAQGFALHLTHAKNARLWTPGDAASFDHEFMELMNTKREGDWSKEALRASMAHSSVDLCTDRCLSVYGLLRPVDYRRSRFFTSLVWFIANWVVASVMK